MENEKKKKKSNGVLFKKGNKGGPGRPKSKGLIKWCKEWTAEKAEGFLGKIAEDEKDKRQLDAIKLILAYGEGQPLQRTEGTLQHEGLASKADKAPEMLDDLIKQGERNGLGADRNSGTGQTEGTA